MAARLPRRLLGAPSFLGACAVALTYLATTPAPVGATTPTTFVVNKAGDAGDRNLSDLKCDTSTRTGNQCTLRAAIQQANFNSTNNIIHFNLPSTARVITPASPLPTITDDGLTIGGYSQSGAQPNTAVIGDNAVLKVTLDGVNAGTSADGLVLQASNASIRGLVIVRFKGDGIRVTGDHDVIAGNFIGADAAGTTKRGNNVGIFVNGPDTTVGGNAVSDRNLISGNTTSGVTVGAAPAGEGHDSSVLGNYIGTTRTGQAALGNGESGIDVESPNVTVGGEGNNAPNVISSNGGSGVSIFHTAGTVVQANTIGTGANGGGNLGNTFGGVSITMASGNGVYSNTIVHNSSAGVFVSFTAGSTEIAFNFISQNSSDGIQASSSLTTIHDNTITANGGAGVLLPNNPHRGIRIDSNQMSANGRLGIDLVGGSENSFGVTANDVGDTDTGINDLQNFPVLTSVAHSTNPVGTRLHFTLNGPKGATMTVEAFVASPDPSGNGEGQNSLGTLDVTLSGNGPSGSGQADVFWILPDEPAGTAFTMTATDENGSTSEFAHNIALP